MGTTFSNGQVASFDFKSPINGQRIIILPVIHIFKENFESFQARKGLTKLESSKGLKRLKCSKEKKVYMYERGNTSLKSQKGLKSVQKD